METHQAGTPSSATTEADAAPPRWQRVKAALSWPSVRAALSWRRVAAALGDPVTLVIVAVTLVGLGLRLYFLLHRGFLLSDTEYDDGDYFGSAVRLTQGVLPYRDFVFVQPPGITLLMVPSALLAKLTGTAWAM